MWTFKFDALESTFWHQGHSKGSLAGHGAVPDISGSFIALKTSGFPLPVDDSSTVGPVFVVSDHEPCPDSVIVGLLGDIHGEASTRFSKGIFPCAPWLTESTTLPWYESDDGDDFEVWAEKMGKMVGVEAWFLEVTQEEVLPKSAYRVAWGTRNAAPRCRSYKKINTAVDAAN